MKRVKFALAGVALVTAALTMSFSSSNDAKESAQANDCWSTSARHLAGLPADRNQSIQCPGNNTGCCVKPSGNPTSPYLEFSQN